MIIVDTALQALEAEDKPIRVGLIGAGFMAQGLCNQIANSVPGMRVAAIYGRRVERAVEILRYSGFAAAEAVSSAEAFDAALRQRQPVATDDPLLLTQSDQIDVLVELTGSVEFGARVAMDAFAHQKAVILMNAELDATIGPILHVHAHRLGGVLSATEGDEPGIQINLCRWVRGLGLTPRVVGNVKGLQDPYRDPTTQQAFAEQWGQNPAMVTSFADGSKISFEQTIVANATGFKVLTRGMSRGVKFDGSPLELAGLYDLGEVRELGGIVDYTVGPANVKVFCLAEHDDPKQRHYLELYKLGPGPLYPFWVPYHLPHFEAPNAIARVALFSDNVAPPLDGPVVEVCAVAKRDIAADEVLDDYGMYMTYGEAVNADEMSEGRYLPEGLVEGCRARRPVAKDSVLTYDDVELPPGRTADALRAEQYRHFRGETWLEELLATPAPLER
ncbi:MAG TPA: SAF domain-containing protein [Gaiellaceae bacterium]